MASKQISKDLNVELLIFNTSRYFEQVTHVVMSISHFAESLGLDLNHLTHIFMVLLEVDELLLQGLDLALQVHAAHVGVVDELPQTDDVGLHRLADGQLRLVSAQIQAVSTAELNDSMTKVTEWFKWFAL